MSVLSSDLRERIVARHHTVTRRELLADGAASRDVDRWLHAGVLRELRPAVYVVTDALAVTPFETRAAARCLGDADAVIDAIGSARCWRLPGIFRPSTPTFLDRSDLPSGFVVERDDGLRVLTPAATWLQLASALPARRFSTWSHQVLGRAIALHDAHGAVRCGADPGRAGHRRAMAVLSTRRRWQRPADTTLERRVRSSCRRRGLRGLDGAARLELDHGLVAHPTVADHERRWGVEIDHVDWHGGRWSPPAERMVDRALHRAGWHIVRVTDLDLEADFLATMNAVVEHHRSTRRAA